MGAVQQQGHGVPRALRESVSKVCQEGTHSGQESPLGSREAAWTTAVKQGPGPGSSMHNLTNIEAKGSLVQSCIAGEHLATGNPGLLNSNSYLKRYRKTLFHFFSGSSKIMCMQTHL